MGEPPCLRIRRKSLTIPPLQILQELKRESNFATDDLAANNKAPVINTFSLSDSLPRSFSDLYTLEDTLGAGTTGIVRKSVRRTDGKTFAVKLLKSDDHEQRQFMRDEYELLRTLQHESIIYVEALHESPSQMFMCMEYCSGGSLEDHINQNGALTEDASRGLFLQLLLGVDYLHRKRIVHRDLKPANLLLQSSNVLKVADFNSAKQIGNGSSLMLTDRGTHTFTAPELYFGHEWNERVDIWACGLTLYYMLWGALPFNITERSVKQALMMGSLPSVNFDGVSALMRSLILQCLTVTMRDRPPALLLLMHPVFHQKPWDTEKTNNVLMAKVLRGHTNWHPGELNSISQTPLSASWQERRDGSDALVWLSERFRERIVNREPLQRPDHRECYRELRSSPTGSGYKARRRRRKDASEYCTSPADSETKAIGTDKVTKFFTTHGGMHVSD